jgi:hypothetical protein
MSTITRIITTIVFLAATAVPALSAAGEREQPNNFVVWMFLGLCALIIIAQVAPLIRNLGKHAKIAAGKSEQAKQDAIELSDQSH